MRTPDGVLAARSATEARSDTEGRPSRPVPVEIVAGLLVFGGLFGITQLLYGDFVITGSLPAKGPILGVAATLYAASLVLGGVIRIGRGWFPAINLAGLFAIVYLAAFGHSVAVLLGVGHAVAVVLLLRERAWFSAVARWRAANARRAPHANLGSRDPARGPVPARTGSAVGQGRSQGSRRGGRNRPSARR